MAHGQIKLRIFPDGRVEAEIDGIRGNGCMKFIPLVEQLTGSEAIDSRRTENYFLKTELNSEVAEVETLRIKGTS
jgi:hypothetical protein